MSKAMRNIFTYGTLIFPEILSAVTGRGFTSEAFSIDDYTSFAVHDQVFPGAVFSESDVLDGRLYSNVDDRSVAILDIFEGELYDRSSLTALKSEKEIDFDIYLFKNSEIDLLSQKSWSSVHFYENDYGDYLSRCKAFHNWVLREL